MEPQDMLDAIEGYTMSDALGKRGITKDYLAGKLKSELNSKETKFLKIKKNSKTGDVEGQIKAMLGEDKKSPKKKYNIVEETAEEMLIAVDVKHLSIQQRAREDAQKLMGVYPAEKKEIDLHGYLEMLSDADLDEKLKRAQEDE